MEDESIISRWEDKISAGSCNFCTRHDYVRVLVVGSNDDLRNLSIRFCPDCFKELCRQGRER